MILILGIQSMVIVSSIRPRHQLTFNVKEIQIQVHYSRI